MKQCIMTTHKQLMQMKKEIPESHASHAKAETGKTELVFSEVSPSVAQTGVHDNP